MPASRPTSPASISTTSIVAINAAQVWLVDALTGSTVPDLKGGTPLTIGNATFATDPAIGKTLIGSGSGVQAYERFALAGTGIGAYPIAGGVIIRGSSLSGLSPGTQGLMCYVDDFNLSGVIELRLNLDNTSGGIYGLFRAISGDSYGQFNSTVTYAPSTEYAIGYRIDSNSQFSIVVNGTMSHGGTAAGSPGWDSSARMGVIGALGRVNSDQSATFDESSVINMALVWRANGADASNIDDTALTDWTNDKWTILDQPAGASFPPELFYRQPLTQIRM